MLFPNGQDYLKFCYYDLDIKKICFLKKIYIILECVRLGYVYWVNKLTPRSQWFYVTNVYIWLHYMLNGSLVGNSAPRIENNGMATISWCCFLNCDFSLPYNRKRMNADLALSFKIIDLKATHITFRIIFSPETTKQMDKIFKTLVSRNWTSGN